MAGQYPNLIAALDVGTTKTCCLVARAGDEGLKVIGAGHQLSQGIRGGVVVDMDAVETSIRAAVDSAERMAGATLDEVYVAVFIDAIVVKVRDGQVANRPVYAAIGVTVDGRKDVLGLWAGTGGEGAKFS